jgi:hypothetical protein
MPNLEIAEVDRAPYFKFQFNWNIRGAGRSTRELVVVEVRRLAPGPGTTPREGPSPPARSGGDR